jgi:hypothetical protein
MTAEQCIANIGSEGRRKRTAFGVIAFAIAVGLLVTLVMLDVDRVWRLTVAIPLLLGGTGVFQARERT